jgi:tetratricopeptide (TPR) repeat protein
MNRASYYLFWLIAPTALAFVSRYPLIMLAVPLCLVGRRWLPDPILYLRRAGRISSLRGLVQANAADVVSRRQLAMLYLEQRKARAAVPLIEAALAREPDSAELLYLRGLCLAGAQRWEDAVASYIAAVQVDPRFRYGDPFLKMAEALGELGRWKDADESLEHYLTINGSSPEALCKRAKAKEKLGDAAGAIALKIEARRVYALLPSWKRRRQFVWWCRSWW